MQMSFHGKVTRALCLLLAAVGSLALSGCKTEAVEIPGLRGPSELAISFLMTANPDFVVADGFQTSAIGLNVRDRDGRAIPNLTILLFVVGAGSIDRNFVVTDGNGMASVTYTSAAGTGGVTKVIARPVGLDFNGEIYREVAIELLTPA
jgi:hypothetical protein